MRSSTISAAKLAANQANAQKSTGPSSPEGKSRVAKNAIKTGLCSTEVVLPGEDLAEFEAMHLDYGRQIRPLAQGLERTLFDELVGAAWKLRRAQRLETELLSQSGDLLKQLDDDQLQKKLVNLARHKTRIERTFYRAMKELKALQTNRLEHNLFFHIPEPLPGLAELKRFAKQSQTSAHSQPPDAEIEPDDLPVTLRARQEQADFAQALERLRGVPVKKEAKAA